MTIKLPPPPPTNDFKSPAWQDWFYKLIALLNTALPGTSGPIMDGSIFGRPHTFNPPSNPGDSQSIRAMDAFLHKPTALANTPDSQSILPNQIFGA